MTHYEQRTVCENLFYIVCTMKDRFYTFCKKKSAELSCTMWNIYCYNHIFENLKDFNFHIYTLSANMYSVSFNVMRKNFVVRFLLTF